jgi:hypothetical protein
MRYHHTKNKGDLGAIRAMADMTEKGWSILLPLTEHAAFDFVAYKGERFLRVQAKYRTAVNGAIVFPMSTCWADRHGVHSVPIDRDGIDVFCVYCPDTGACYYVDPKTWGEDNVLLRIDPPRNGQKKRIRWAKDYREIPSMVRGIRAGDGSGLVGWGWVRQSACSRAA